MSIAEKLQTIAENEQRVYEAGESKGKADGITEGYINGKTDGYAEGKADGFNVGYESGKADGITEGIEEGKDAEWNAFWDAYQDYGKRGNYNTMFYNAGWTEITFKPKYDFICTYAGSMFSASRIVEINKTIDVTNSTSVASMFYGASYLKTITKLIVSENNNFGSNGFGSCPALENLTIEGTLGQSFDIHWSTKLTHDSLMSIINALKDYAGTNTHTVTLGSTNLAKLTDAEKAIATQKGWTLA